MTLDSFLIAVATLLWNKAQEKIGENIGDALWNAPGKLIELLWRKNKIPSLTSEEPQRLDYGQAVRELTEAAQDPEIAQAIVDVEAAVNNDQSETAEEIKKKAAEIKSHPSVVNKFGKLAETLTVKNGGIVGQSITIEKIVHHHH
ncbi:MAG: hypothetical protein KAF91_26720 [Nostoc sp. TH1S01]|nr:hypothetical protein [Nostoc sp. TH1S01]